MTKPLISALVLSASLALTTTAMAQASGGRDAKGNAPLKPAHTVNDGAAKRGANSFTQKQAQEHIEKSGFTGVTNLVKGDDGVWRGQAVRNGVPADVAMDFKGNVSTPPAAHASLSATSTTRAEPMAPPAHTGETTTTQATVAAAGHATRRHHRRHHHQAVACASPSPTGAACSGVDRNHNGVSDKEDRAIQAGARP